jgi:hypothetical protein
MQKDYMNMAQGGQTAEVADADVQITDQEFSEMGLPTGEGPEAAKQRIMKLLEEMGALEDLEPAEKQELMQLVDQLIIDMEAGDFESVEQNPIMQLLGSVFEEMGIGQEGAEAGMQPADMAGMAGGGGGMPGGGMPGGGMPPMPGGGI